MVELEMQVAGLPDWQTKMVNPNFAQVAEACGIRGYSIKNPENLESNLKEALLHAGPVLVEVFTNPYVPVLPPYTSVSMISHYVEAQAKMAMNGRIRKVWGALKTTLHYLRDLR